MQYPGVGNHCLCGAKDPGSLQTSNILVQSVPLKIIGRETPYNHTVLSNVYGAFECGNVFLEPGLDLLHGARVSVDVSCK